MIIVKILEDLSKSLKKRKELKQTKVVTKKVEINSLPEFVLKELNDILKGLSNNLSKNAIGTLYNLKWLNHWEYQFCKGVHMPGRHLSQRQWYWKGAVNKKLLKKLEEYEKQSDTADGINC